MIPGQRGEKPFLPLEIFLIGLEFVLLGAYKMD